MPALGKVRVEIDYEPRPLQRVVHEAMWHTRFGVLVCHRRFGKTVLSINHLIRAALQSKKQRPRFAYIGPTYRQGKSTVWDFCKHYSRPIPGAKFNESELRADYPNGGQVRIYGGDDPDTLRGLYFDGVVVDEYGLHQGDIFTSVLRPALSDRQGWALFLGTPNGKNQFYEMIYGDRRPGGWVGAKEDPDWFFAEYKASQTGILSPVELAAARAVMTKDEFDQEFECSFEAAVRGSIYGAELEKARTDGRVTGVPYNKLLPVDTDWDLGFGAKGDSTAIWFSQSLRNQEVRLIDYYEASGEGIPFYAQVLKDKGYTYGQHWAPHDIAVQEMSGKSRIETAALHGIRFRQCPNIAVEDQIHAARMLFSRCWFDEKKCKPGLEALQHYRRDFNQKLNELKATPVHDWSSHGAAAFQYLAVRHQTPKPATRARGHIDGYPDRSGVGWLGT